MHLNQFISNINQVVFATATKTFQQTFARFEYIGSQSEILVVGKLNEVPSSPEVEELKNMPKVADVNGDEITFSHPISNDLFKEIIPSTLNLENAPGLLSFDENSQEWDINVNQIALGTSSLGFSGDLITKRAQDIPAITCDKERTLGHFQEVWTDMTNPTFDLTKPGLQLYDLAVNKNTYASGGSFKLQNNLVDMYGFNLPVKEGNVDEGEYMLRKEVSEINKVPDLVITSCDNSSDGQKLNGKLNGLSFSKACNVVKNASDNSAISKDSLITYSRVFKPSNFGALRTALPSMQIVKNGANVQLKNSLDGKVIATVSGVFISSSATYPAGGELAQQVKANSTDNWADYVDAEFPLTNYMFLKTANHQITILLKTMTEEASVPLNDIKVQLQYEKYFLSGEREENIKSDDSHLFNSQVKNLVIKAVLKVRDGPTIVTKLGGYSYGVSEIPHILLANYTLLSDANHDSYLSYSKVNSMGGQETVEILNSSNFTDDYIPEILLNNRGKQLKIENVPTIQPGFLDLVGVTIVDKGDSQKWYKMNNIYEFEIKENGIVVGTVSFTNVLQASLAYPKPVNLDKLIARVDLATEEFIKGADASDDATVVATALKDSIDDFDANVVEAVLDQYAKAFELFAQKSVTRTRNQIHPVKVQMTNTEAAGDAATAAYALRSAAVETWATSVKAQSLVNNDKIMTSKNANGEKLDTVEVNRAYDQSTENLNALKNQMENHINGYVVSMNNLTMSGSSVNNYSLDTSVERDALSTRMYDVNHSLKAFANSAEEHAHSEEVKLQNDLAEINADTSKLQVAAANIELVRNEMEQQMLALLPAPVGGGDAAGGDAAGGDAAGGDAAGGGGDAAAAPVGGTIDDTGILTLNDTGNPVAYATASVETDGSFSMDWKAAQIKAPVGYMVVLSNNINPSDNFNTYENDISDINNYLATQKPFSDADGGRGGLNVTNVSGNNLYAKSGTGEHYARAVAMPGGVGTDTVLDIANDANPTINFDNLDKSVDSINGYATVTGQKLVINGEANAMDSFTMSMPGATNPGFVVTADGDRDSVYYTGTYDGNKSSIDVLSGTYDIYFVENMNNTSYDDLELGHKIRYIVAPNSSSGGGGGDGGGFTPNSIDGTPTYTSGTWVKFSINNLETLFTANSFYGPAWEQFKRGGTQEDMAQYHRLLQAVNLEETDDSGNVNTYHLVLNTVGLDDARYSLVNDSSQYKDAQFHTILEDHVLGRVVHDSYNITAFYNDSNRVSPYSLFTDSTSSFALVTSAPPPPPAA
jgi:hypothetical protein